MEQGFNRPDALLLPTKHCLRSYFDLIDSLTSRKKTCAVILGVAVV